MTDDKVAAIVQSLWHPLEDGTIPNVFMVLDCARDKRIEPLINKSNIEQSCLYSGKLAYKLKRAAPHIVKLEAESDFTSEVLSLAWGNSWGVFFIASDNVSMAAIRHNCRKINMVKTHEEKMLVFRYQDPRVLRQFLPICDKQQLEFIFGSAFIIAMEDASFKQLIRYSIDNVKHKLSTQALNVNF